MSDSINCSALDGGCRRRPGRFSTYFRAAQGRRLSVKNTQKGGESINDDSDDPLTQQARINEIFRQLTPENQAKAIIYLETLKGGAYIPQAYLCSRG